MSKHVDIKLPNDFFQVVEHQIVEISTSKDRYIEHDEYDTDTDDIVSHIEKVNQTKIRILQAKVICARKWLIMVTQYYLYGLLMGYHIEVDTRKINNTIFGQRLP